MRHLPKPHHQVDAFKRLLEPLGIEHSTTLPRLHLLASEREAARATLRKYGVTEGAKVVGISPGSAHGSAKRWLPSRFHEVAKRLLADPNLYVVCLGVAGEVPLIKEICSGLPDRVINLAGGTSLRELCAVIAACDAVLANDNGPMQIAAAVGTPVLGIFGPTDEGESGPLAGGQTIRKEVTCSPCHLRSCPIEQPCMSQLPSDEVYEQLIALLSQKAD